MTRRTVKWLILIPVLCLVVVCVGLLLYFTLFAKSAYKICAVELSDTKVDDLSNSEMKLYKNGTFHVKIEHKENGLIFLGIGTYQQEGGNYVLSFEQVLGRQNNVVSDKTEQYYDEAVTCLKSGNRIKFVDHNNQVYYFG